MKKISLIVVAVLGLLASAVFASANKQDAVSLVEKAASYLKTNGKDKLLAEIGTKDGQFHKGELYVVVYDMNGIVLAHPVNAKLVGKDFVNVPDVDGKLFRKEFVEVAKTKGSGWVDYRYKNPVSNKIEAKTSYVLRVDDVFLMAGIYKD